MSDRLHAYLANLGQPTAWASNSALAEDLLHALKALYVPDPWAGDETPHNRRRHYDIPSMTDQQLWQHAERCRFLLAWLDNPDPWLSERLDALRAETARRKGASHARP